MKYRNWWHSNVIRVIKAYPALKEKKDTLQSQSVTASYSSEPHGANSVHRTTETIALRQLPKGEENALEAVEKALERISLLKDGEQTLELIRLYYWRNGGRFLDIADRLYISERTARRRNAIFLQYVAEGLGYR